MLFSLFVIGTFWFWLLLGAAALCVGVCVTRESFGKATLFMLGTFLALALFGDFNVLHWLRGHAAEFLVWFAAYFAIGTAWSVAKWWFFVRRVRDEYDERKREFLRNHDVQGEAIPENLKARWREQMGQPHGYLARNSSVRTFPPRARDYKGKITAWMVYWPWSMLVTLIDDPIRKLFSAIFRAIQGVYQRISDSAFKSVSADFDEAPSAPKTGNGTPPPSGPERRAARPEDGPSL